MAGDKFRMTRRGFMAAGLSTLALPLAGCGTTVAAGLAGSQLDPKTLIYWNLFGGGDGVRMQAMEAGYQKTHGGPASLQATTFAWGNPYYSKLTLATVGDKPPDVAISHLTRAKPLADGGILDPITEEDLASVGLSSSDFNQAAWNSQRTNGKNIAIPLDTHPLVMFFNSDICKKAGLLQADGNLKPIQGMDQFEAALAAVSKATGGVAITVANVGDFATPWRFFQTLYSQHNGSTPYLANGGTKIGVDEGIAIDTLSRIQSWVKKGWLSQSLDYGTAESYLFSGKSGFYLEGEWEISTAEAVKGFKFGMVPVPQLYDKPAAQADSHTFVLPRKDRTPEQRKQAMGFIKSMLDQSLTWAKGGHIPAYLPTLHSTAYKNLEPQANYADAAKHAVYDAPAWYSGSGSTFESIAGAQIALVQQGAITPQGALKAISDQLQVYLRTPSPL